MYMRTALVVAALVAATSALSDVRLAEEREAAPKEDPPVRIGGKKDGERCIGSAGYSWCEPKQKCLRVWEEACE